MFRGVWWIGKILQTATLFDGCGCRFSLEAFVYILWVWQFLARGIEMEVQNGACPTERGLRFKGSGFETLNPKPKTAPLEGKPPSSSVGCRVLVFSDSSPSCTRPNLCAQDARLFQVSDSWAEAPYAVSGSRGFEGLSGFRV